MKKFLYFVSGIILGMILIVPANAKNEQTRPLKIWYENSNGKMSTYCLVDDSTGVNYIVVSAIGNTGSPTVAICPRYNADGTLFK